MCIHQDTHYEISQYCVFSKILFKEKRTILIIRVDIQVDEDLFQRAETFNKNACVYKENTHFVNQ